MTRPPSVTPLRKLLGKLQGEVRKPFDIVDHGMTRRVPADIDLGQTHWEISRRSHELFLDTIAYLNSDIRFEHLDRHAEDEVWLFVCRCLAHARDHREQFIKDHQQEPITIAHYFAVRHLEVRQDFELANCQISGLPLAGGPDLSSLSKERDVSAVIMVKEPGTLATHQAARAHDRAEYALQLLRVCLRPQNQLSRSQLKFSLGEQLVTDYGPGFQRSPDAPYTATLRPNLTEQAGRERAADLPMTGGTDVEQQARLAVKWLSRAQLADEWLIRLLYLFFALEALLGDKADKRKGHDLAFRRAMLSHATGNAFSEPSATLYLYAEVRSAAVHGSEAPSVSDNDLTSLEFDMHRALEEYLEFAHGLGLTRRSKLREALENHEDRAALIDWLQQHDPGRWGDYAGEVPSDSDQV